MTFLAFSNAVWCVCELFLAKKHNSFPEQTFVAGPNNFKDVATSCVGAKATNDEDKPMTLRALLKNPGDADLMDETIQEFCDHETSTVAAVPHPPISLKRN